MKFYNREKELQELAHLRQRRPSFAVITGKRRVGKTKLLLRFLDKGEIYFFVDDKKNEALLVQEYLEILQKSKAIPEVIGAITTLEQLWKLIFNCSKDTPITLAIDEFQRFLKINPSLINQLQKQWDLEGKQSKLFLLASGSSVGMIKKIFVEEGAPLFKRADNIIFLPPLSVKTIFSIAGDLGINGFEEKMKCYFLFGRMPYYYELMEKYEVKSFEEAIDQLLLREFAPLKNEVQEIMIEEFGRAHPTYYEILNALALGKNTKTEMADYVHVEETSLSPYLRDLIELVQVVDYFILPTENPLKSKKGRYIIADNFFSFWFFFIFRYKSFYEQGKFSEIKKRIEQQKSSFFGRQFERLCRELSGQLIPLTFERTNSWFGHYRDAEGNRKEVEIDICSVNGQSREILFGECKWQERVDARKVLTELKEKTKYVEWHKDGRKEYYALFAKSFKEKIKEDRVYLYDLSAIEKKLK